MAKCSKCGAEVMEGALFCTECGEAMAQPFEGAGAAIAQNPFEDFSNSEPKPQAASEQIFGDSAGQTNSESSAQQGAWSAADERARESWEQQYQPNQGWNAQESIYAAGYGDVPEGNDKLWSVISYISIILWLVSFLLGSKNSATGQRSSFYRHHLNQGLVVNIAGVIGTAIGSQSFIGWLINLFVFVLAVMGIVSAVRGNTKPLPLIGGIQLIK